MFAIIATEIGDLGIVGSLTTVAPDISQAIKASTQNAFSRSLVESQRQPISSKKSKKVAQRLSSTWWWCDLALPSLYCLSSCASAITSETSAANTAFVDTTLGAAIDALDLFAVVERPHIHTGEEEEEEEGTRKSSIGDGLLAGCEGAIDKLIGAIIGDQVKVSIEN